MNKIPEQKVKLDLNNPAFQRQLFNLQKRDQRGIIGTLRMFSNMTWRQVYSNQGLKWEIIVSRKGPQGGRIYSFQIPRAQRLQKCP